VGLTLLRAIAALIGVVLILGSLVDNTAGLLGRGFDLRVWFPAMVGRSAGNGGPGGSNKEIRISLLESTHEPAGLPFPIRFSSITTPDLALIQIQHRLPTHVIFSRFSCSSPGCAPPL
jgi:hypothetical protein